MVLIPDWAMTLFQMDADIKVKMHLAVPPIMLAKSFGLKNGLGR